ncbi:MAG TPA: Gfo/Idh/MocA family oxidoreductase [Patescibacteria group bacterium]|nr:Gfo/Idh/MocA family oxidoreductase [Patescibacteria group bacterium]
MRIALLGAGRIGQLHGQLVAAQPGVDEVIVHDLDAARAATVAGLVGGRTAATPEAAVADADAVLIAASTHVHAALAELAIDAGLPVFVEKPLAFDLDQTVALVQKAERAGAVVQVGFQRRFDPAYVEAKRLLDAGELGTLYMVRLIAHDHTPPPDAYIPVSGGLFRDSSIHDFDALRWLTGQEVVEVYAAGAVRNFPLFARHDDVDTGAVILTLADGTLGSHAQTRHNPHGYDVRMEVIGSRDVVCVGLDQGTPMRSLEKGAPRVIGPAWDSFLDRFEEAYRTEILAFLKVARGEAPSPCTARDALEAMRISVAATVSRKEHRPVSLTEIG